MPFEIQIENLNEIREAFRMYPVIANREIQSGLLEAGKVILANEKGESPVGVTAQLRLTIGLRLKSGSVIISPNKQYALSVHQGTRPHYVSVRDKRAPLRLWAIKKGINPYALQKSIMRKGTKANPFVDRTVQKSEWPVRRIFVGVLERIIKSL
ncbi:MAG: hypothetical protein V1867_00990 [Candidatus Falkowbacteria bacterium]